MTDPTSVTTPVAVEKATASATDPAPASEQPVDTSTAPETEAEHEPADPGEGEDPESEAKEESAAEKLASKRARRIDKLTSDRRERDERIRQLEADLEAARKPADDAETIDPEKLAEKLAEAKVMAIESRQSAEKLMNAGKSKFGAAFEAKVGDLVQDVGPLMDRQGRLHPLLEAVIDSEHAAEVMHQLVEDTELAAELYRLTPARIGRRIAKIEDEIAAAAKPKPSKAAKPLEPVKPSSAPSVDEAKLSDSEWLALRKKARMAG